MISELQRLFITPPSNGKQYINYCIGRVDDYYQIIECGKGYVNGAWIKIPDPNQYNLRTSYCPDCAKADLLMLGMEESEIEKILSLSG